MRASIFAVLFFFAATHSSFATEQTFQNNDINIKIITGDNISPNTPFSVKTIFSVNGSTAEVNDIGLGMRMRNMNMGKFDYTTVFDKTSGAYIFDSVTLPSCMSGKKEWIGTLKYKYNYTAHETIFIINLQ